VSDEAFFAKMSCVIFLTVVWMIGMGEEVKLDFQLVFEDFFWHRPTY